MRGWILGPVVVWLLLALDGAQASDLEVGLEAKIPFEFIVNGQVFPPGDYVVDLASAEDPRVLTIGPREKRAPVLFTTQELGEKHDPGVIELVFDEFGNKIYLAEVWGLEATGLEVRNTAPGLPKIPPDHTHRRVGGRRASRPAGTGDKGQ